MVAASVRFVVQPHMQGQMGVRLGWVGTIPVACALWPISSLGDAHRHSGYSSPLLKCAASELGPRGRAAGSLSFLCLSSRNAVRALQGVFVACMTAAEGAVTWVSTFPSDAHVSLHRVLFGTLMLCHAQGKAQPACSSCPERSHDDARQKHSQLLLSLRQSALALQFTLSAVLARALLQN